MGKPEAKPASFALVRLGACALLFALIAFSARGGSLYDGDEAIYAEFVREMREGDVFTLRFDGFPVHQRPPLYPWILLVSTSLLGESELALRIPSALATALTLLVVMRMARRIRAPSTAAAAAYLGLATTWAFSRAVESEPLLGLFCALAIDAALTGAWLYFGLFLGASMLVKQAVGLLPIVAVLAIRWRIRDVARAVAVALAVWAPWHIYMTARYGCEFWENYVGLNVLARALHPVLSDSAPTFYWDAFAKREGSLAAILIVGLATVAFVRAWRRRDRNFFAIAVPVAIALVAFTSAQSRVEYYLLLVTPLLAVVAAYSGFGLSGWRLAIMLALLVLVPLAVHGPPTLGVLDHSPQTRRLARRVSREAGHRVDDGVDDRLHYRLYVVGMQPSAARYYSGLPTTRVFWDERAFQRNRAIDVLSVPGLLVSADPHDLCAVFKPPGFIIAKSGAERAMLENAHCQGALVASDGPYALFGVP